GKSDLGFGDARGEAEEGGALTYIGIRHEGAAAFAASAYGKLTGRLAACFAIAGPGSTNLLTGLYDAKVDRAPVLAISGQVPSKVRGRGAFQDLDLAAAFADVAVSTQTVHRDSDQVELMNLACKQALIQRGVAHLVLPDEVQALPAPERARPGGPAGRIPDPAVATPEAAVDRVADVAPRRSIWHAEKDRRAGDDHRLGVASAPLFEMLARHAPSGAVIAVDVGNNTYSFGRYFECKPGQQVLMSGYLGSIGF